jgi:hypothetical protein
MRTKQMKAILSVVLMSSSVAWAESLETQSEVDVRSTRRLGAYLGVGTPSPGPISLNAAYNITSMVRAEAGYSEISVSPLLGGEKSTAAVYGVGVRGMLPGQALTPTVGLHYGLVSTTGKALTLKGFEQGSGSHVSVSAGVDYQARGGFHGGLGYNLSLRSGVGGSAYLSLGWFFDVPKL